MPSSDPARSNSASASCSRPRRRYSGPSISPCRGLDLHHLPRPRHCLVAPAEVGQARDMVAQEERVEGVGPQALGALGEGLLEPPHVEQEEGVPGRTWASPGFDSMAFRYSASAPAQSNCRKMTARQGEVAFGQLGIQLQGLPRMHFQPGHGLRRWQGAHGRERNITEGQGGVRQGEAGVLLDRLLQVAHALEQNGLDVVDGPAVEEVAAAQVEVVGLGVDIGRVREARLLGRRSASPGRRWRRRGRSRPAARACRRPPLRNSGPRDADRGERG